MTTPMRPKPVLRAAGPLPVAPTTAKVAAVMTAMPTEVPMRCPVCMNAPELPA